MPRTATSSAGIGASRPARGPQRGVGGPARDREGGNGGHVLRRPGPLRRDGTGRHGSTGAGCGLRSDFQLGRPRAAPAARHRTASAARPGGVRGLRAGPEMARGGNAASAATGFL